LSQRPLLARIADALLALSGERATLTAPVQDSRAILPAPFPSGQSTGGKGGVQMVRAATPGEIKTYGSEVRKIGFQKHPVVHACFRAIADIFASIPLVVLKDRLDEDSRVPVTHPLQILLDTPAPRITARQLRARFCTDFLGYGNALWKMDRAGRRIRSLRPINAEAIQNVWVDAEGDAAIYSYSDWNGVVREARVEDVVHFRDLEMPRPYYPDVFGYPRGATALQSIVTDLEASNYTRQVLKNDGTPTMAVLLDEGVDQEDADAMKARYREKVVTRGMRADPAFFAGVKDVKALGFTLSELEFPDLRRVSREDICSAYGVDPRMIGAGSASNDGGLSGVQYAEARRRLIQHTIEPLLSAFCDELNAWLAPEFGDVWVAPDNDILRDLVENDEETSLRVEREVKGSLRTWQEGRRALKLSDKPDPKESLMLPLGVQLLPVAVAFTDPALSVTPGGGTPEALKTPAGEGGEGGEGEGAAKPAEGGAAAAGDDDELNEDGKKGERAMGEAVAVDGSAEKVNAAPLDPRYVRWRSQNDVLDAEEAKYGLIARSLFAVEKKRIVAIFNRAAEGQVTEVGAVGSRAKKGADSMPGWADPILEEAVRRALLEYAKGGDLWLGWVESFRELVKRTFLKGATDAVTGIKTGGGAFNFQLSNPYVQKAVEDRVTRLATLITEDTARQVTAAVRAGEAAGFNIAEIARLIETTAYGENMTANRARTIARTESALAFSQGGWDQAKEAGIFRSKEWLAFEDNVTRETHLGCMAEGRIPLDQPFASNGLLYPLDPSGEAAEVINCRCTLVYYDEDPPTKAAQ
jgi:HK97 family phage portal protein